MSSVSEFIKRRECPAEALTKWKVMREREKMKSVMYNIHAWSNIFARFIVKTQNKWRSYTKSHWNISILATYRTEHLPLQTEAERRWRCQHIFRFPFRFSWFFVNSSAQLFQTAHQEIPVHIIDDPSQKRGALIKLNRADDYVICIRYTFSENNTWIFEISL